MKRVGQTWVEFDEDELKIVIWIFEQNHIKEDNVEKEVNWKWRLSN
jgi:hypothetical protein